MTETPQEVIKTIRPGDLEPKVSSKTLNPGDPGHKPVQLYLAGPMRGFEYFNFPAFDKHKEKLEECGWKVVSPADLDRAAGFDPDHVRHNGFYEFVENCEDWPLEMDANDIIRRDMNAVMDPETKAMAMLPCWWLSTGATAEYYLARMRGLYIFEADTFKEITAKDVDLVMALPDPDDVNLIEQVFDKSSDEDPCDEAKRITSGDRNDDYGPPDIDMLRIAKLWSAYLGTLVTQYDVPQMMTLLKVSREKHATKRDNAVDAIGYQRIYQLMREGKQP